MVYHSSGVGQGSARGAHYPENRGSNPRPAIKVIDKLLYEIYKNQPITVSDLARISNKDMGYLNRSLLTLINYGYLRRFRPDVPKTSPIPYKYIITPRGVNRRLVYLGLVSKEEADYYEVAIYPELVEKMKEYEENGYVKVKDEKTLKTDE